MMCGGCDRKRDLVRQQTHLLGADDFSVRSNRDFPNEPFFAPEAFEVIEERAYGSTRLVFAQARR